MELEELVKDLSMQGKGLDYFSQRELESHWGLLARVGSDSNEFKFNRITLGTLQKNMLSIKMEGKDQWEDAVVFQVGDLGLTWSRTNGAREK